MNHAWAKYWPRSLGSHEAKYFMPPWRGGYQTYGNNPYLSRLDQPQTQLVSLYHPMSLSMPESCPDKIPRTIMKRRRRQKKLSLTLSDLFFLTHSTVCPSEYLQCDQCTEANIGYPYENNSEILKSDSV